MLFFDTVYGFIRGLFGNGSVGHFMDTYALVFQIILLCMAGYVCFFGYNKFRFWCGVVGFVAFYALGTGLSVLFLPASVPLFIVGLVLGLVGGILSYTILKVGIFLVGGCFAFGLAYALTAANMPISLLIGLGVGVVSWWASDYVVILSCAAAGGWSLGTGLVKFAGIPSQYTLYLCIGLAVAGVATQIIMYHKGGKKKLK